MDFYFLKIRTAPLSRLAFCSSSLKEQGSAKAASKTDCLILLCLTQAYYYQVFPIPSTLTNPKQTDRADTAFDSHYILIIAVMASNGSGSPRPPNAWVLSGENTTAITQTPTPNSESQGSNSNSRSITPSSHPGTPTRFFPRSYTLAGDSSTPSPQPRSLKQRIVSGSNPRALSYHPHGSFSGAEGDVSPQVWSDVERQSNGTANNSDIVLQGRS